MVTKKRTFYRSAVTGEFVSEAYAKKHPKQTVKETASVRQPPSKKSKKT